MSTTGSLSQCLRQRPSSVIGLGLGLVFIGYSLTYYGVSQLRGGNWGLLDLVVPARWDKAQTIPVDSFVNSGKEKAQT